MATDTKHKDLEGLRIDRSTMADAPPAPFWSRLYILVGIGVFVLLGLAALAYRLMGSTPEVEVVRATAEGGQIAGSVVLTATSDRKSVV